MRLALASVRARAATFAATGLSIFLGATVILSFLTLMDTALGEGVSAVSSGASTAESVSARDQETLATMAGVVGGWGLILVVFSVASTLGLAVRQRAEEFGLLRTTGATRRQLRRMVTAETLVVAIGATALAVLPGWLLGRLVLDLVADGGLVAPSVEHQLGWLSLSGTLVVVLVAGLGAGALAVRPVLRGSAAAALARSRTQRRSMGRGRIAGAGVLFALGATYSTLAVTVGADSSDPYLAMSLAGPASSFWSMGLALLAPVLLRGAAALVSGPLARTGPAGYLAAYNTRRRAGLLAGTLMPVIVFVGIGTGTFYLMAVENSAGLGTGTVDGQIVALLNYVVVGLIAAFAAIMVVNTAVAGIADRRREFGLQRLAGSTRGQVVTMLLVEGGLIAVTGIVLGGLASLGTVIPYAVVKTDGWLPTSGPWLFLGVCAVALAVTLGTTRISGQRAVRGRAVDAALAR